MNGQERRIVAAAMLRDRAALRMPFHGGSMLPLLRAPMVLQLGSPSHARVGDVVVFTRGDVRVAHRLIGIEHRGIRTAGDAQPAIVECVPHEDVIGRVVAVWSDPSSNARRIDGIAYRLAGWYFARFHPLRRRIARARARIADLAARAQPRRRARTTLRLIAALTAAEGNDAVAFAYAAAIDAAQLRAVDERHRCTAVLGEAARRHGVVDQLPAETGALMRRSRLEAVLAASRLHRAIGAVVELLGELAVPFALLKGAARIYAGTAEAACHVSQDIDVLVRRSDLEVVVEALLREGYTDAKRAAAVKDYGKHHHAVPLFPPAGAFPIELHHALAPPGSLSTVTDWDRLAPHLVGVDGPAGTVTQLDPVGTALHLGIHAIGFTRLRDVALLARALRGLDAGGLDALRAVVRSERRDPVRLEASFLLAARIAGIRWDAGIAVERYVRWALVREDLPVSLRDRCDALDAYVAHPGAPWPALRALVPWWSRGTAVAAVPGRIAGRCATNAAALIYAACMRGDDRGVT
jgi:putative nucleotidyltransferase-like protein